MQAPNSPLFPTQKLALSPNLVSTGGEAGMEGSALIPQLPDKPITQTSSIQVFIIPAEENLYVQGFEPEEYSDRPPTLLRGCLVLRVLKPSKIKSITLVFKGQQRTDWPEGIPPKKTSYAELNDILSHTWPFYQQGTAVQSNNGGADFYRELAKGNADGDVSHLNIADNTSRSHSPLPDFGSRGNFFTRNLSPATNFMKRATSPSLVNNENSFTDLTAVLSGSETDLTKVGNFPPGDYIYNFEHPLHPSIPESSQVTFGEVNYYIEASIARIGTFKSNLAARLPINVVRVPSESNLEEYEPIIITRDWEDQLRYDIVIGRKSIVLDTYLPLAVRFVPLWGKVALHRIRVYLSENLEYYCNNKKVHRMEPPKKFLLLEHKAKKGKSLLSKNGGQNEDENDDDEVLPKELEFQLFVPKQLDDKFKHQIHPDTSYENIQSHHWIKICLRLSKTDPEDAEKRKHYEISIDSPIHILSPLAAHGNTLLPPYDEHIENSAPQNLPDYRATSPPLSPEVISIDNTSGNNGLSGLSIQHQFNSSLYQTMEQPFHVMNSSLPISNPEPINKSLDMHLEANLYKPDNATLTSNLNSPQAVPHSGTFQSPVQRPIHFVRKPSTNPPPFEAKAADPLVGVENFPPPAYEEEVNSMSMSPLRIDEDISRGRNRINNMMPVITQGIAQETPVKDLLSQQLRPKAPEMNPISFEDQDISDLSHSVQPPDISPTRHAISPNRHAISPNRHAISPTRHSQSSTISSDTATNSIISSTQSNDTKTTNDNEEPIINSRTSEERHMLVDSGAPKNISKAVTGRTVSNSKPSTELLNNSEKSRQSSIVSNGSSFDLAVEQTIPLLNQSSHSLTVPISNIKSRNSSVNSLTDRRTSNVNEMTKIIDLVDGGDINNNIYKLNGNLLHLRNPGAKSHYKKTIGGDIAEEDTSKLRTKSFGVINRNGDSACRNSSSSESTVNEAVVDGSSLNVMPNSNDIMKSTSPVEGFKYGYIID